MSEVHGIRGSSKNMKTIRNDSSWEWYTPNLIQKQILYTAEFVTTNVKFLYENTVKSTHSNSKRICIFQTTLY